MQDLQQQSLKMQVFNHKLQPLRKKSPTCLASHPLVVTVRDQGDHGKGLAIDFMVPVSSALGDQIAEYAVQNMASRGINFIIWKQRFYAPIR